MLTRIEYSNGPHPSLFQINYVFGNDYLTLLGLKEYCSDVDSTARYFAGMYQNVVQTQTMTDLRQFVLDWRDILVNEYGFDKSDTLLPKIATNPFQLNIFERIVKAQPISVCTANQIFNGACVANGLAPLSIHSVRRTRARHIENITHDDHIVALQQDFGHSSIGTTRCNYGNITPSHQRELIAGIKVE